MGKLISTGEVRRVDGATYPVEYTYNGLGKQATMTTFKDANTPQVTSWTYNARGEMVQKTYADGNSVNYTYNADGQLLTRTWARGIVTTYTYDNAGRATGYNYSDGVTPAVAITLDFLDRQSSITDAAGTRNFSYNANNQLGNETNPSIMNGMITYAYDNAGRRTGMNLSNGTDSFAQANYTYDTQGRIATVGNNTDTLAYTYVPGTNMIGSAAWQNASINTVNTYDQYKRLTNIAVNGENVYGYTLNDKNQRTSATLPDGNKWNYTYDVMGQLTGAVKQDTTNNPLANMNYFYDLIGNRTSATENSATTTYTSNIVNQYTAVNAVVPVYDLDGNMINYNGWTYTYNGENRLIVAENAADGVRIEADYDYMGRRIFKKVYNNNTLVKHSIFIYDGFKQIAEFDVLNNNSLKASYLWQPIGLDVVLLRNAEYLIADGNKNIIQIRNATGSVTDSYVYDPFGKVTHEGSSENPFQFSSEFFDDETELVYYNYRYYMPIFGRWIIRDPIEEEGGSLLYRILNNNVISYIDWLGLNDIDNIENKYIKMIMAASFIGADFAADNLEHFLRASGKTKIIDWKWLRSFYSVRWAERVNLGRFEEQLKSKAKFLSDGEMIMFYDFWDKREKQVLSELYYASGDFTITSYGAFKLDRMGNCIKITGSVDHYWWDPYDWHNGLSAWVPIFGNISDSDGIALERAKRAKSFLMESEWFQSLDGLYVVYKYLWNDYSFKWSLPQEGSSGARNNVIEIKGSKAIRPSK